MINKLTKLIKIEYRLIKMNLITLSVYRTNLILIFFGSAFFNFGAFLFFEIIFSNITLFAGWQKWDIILIYGLSQIFFYLQGFYSHGNFSSFPDKVNSGELDLYLTKPFDSMILSTTNYFSFESLSALPQALFIVIIAFSKTNYNVNAFGLITAIISIILSLIIAYLIQVITIIPSFKLIKNRFFMFMRETEDLSSYPYEIFQNKIVRFIFFTILPYGLFINIPFRALIGKLNPLLLLLQLLVLSWFLKITRNLWDRAIKHYSSASS